MLRLVLAHVLASVASASLGEVVVAQSQQNSSLAQRNLSSPSRAVNHSLARDSSALAQLNGTKARSLGAFKTIKKGVTKTVKKGTKAVSSFVSGAVTEVISVPSSVADTAGSVWKAVSSLVEKLGNKVEKSAQYIADLFGSSLGDLGYFAKKMGPWVLAKGHSAFQDAVQAIKDLVGHCKLNMKTVLLKALMPFCVASESDIDVEKVQSEPKLLVKCVLKERVQAEWHAVGEWPGSTFFDTGSLSVADPIANLVGATTAFNSSQLVSVAAEAKAFFQPTIRTTFKPTKNKLWLKLSGKMEAQSSFRAEAHSSVWLQFTKKLPAQPKVQKACTPVACLVIIYGAKATVEVSTRFSGVLDVGANVEFPLEVEVDLDYGSGKADSKGDAGELTTQEQVTFSADFDGHVRITLEPFLVVLPIPGVPVFVSPLVTLEAKTRAQAQTEQDLLGPDMAQWEACVFCSVNLHAQYRVEGYGFPIELDINLGALENELKGLITSMGTAISDAMNAALGNCLFFGDTWVQNKINKVVGALNNLVDGAFPDFGLTAQLSDPTEFMKETTCKTLITDYMVSEGETGSCWDPTLTCR